MQHKHKLAIALGLLALLGAVEVAQARLINFGGTRSALARACTGPSRVWTSGIDYNGLGWAMCIDQARNTSVVCDERGSCIGSVPNASTPKPRVPRGIFEPPESLSEQSSGDPSIEPPPVNPETDVIIIN